MNLSFLWSCYWQCTFFSHYFHNHKNALSTVTSSTYNLLTLLFPLHTCCIESALYFLQLWHCVSLASHPWKYAIFWSGHICSMFPCVSSSRPTWPFLLFCCQMWWIACTMLLNEPYWCDDFIECEWYFQKLVSLSYAGWIHSILCIGSVSCIISASISSHSNVGTTHRVVIHWSTDSNDCWLLWWNLYLSATMFTLATNPFVRAHTAWHCDDNWEHTTWSVIPLLLGQFVRKSMPPCINQVLADSLHTVKDICLPAFWWNSMRWNK